MCGLARDVDEEDCDFPTLAVLVAGSSLLLCFIIRLVCAASLRRTGRLLRGRFVAQRRMKTGWCVSVSLSARPNWSFLKVLDAAVEWTTRHAHETRAVCVGPFEACTPERRRSRSRELRIIEHVGHRAMHSHVEVAADEVDVEPLHVGVQSLEERSGNVAFLDDHVVQVDRAECDRLGAPTGGLRRRPWATKAAKPHVVLLVDSSMIGYMTASGRNVSLLRRMARPSSSVHVSNYVEM